MFHLYSRLHRCLSLLALLLCLASNLSAAAATKPALLLAKPYNSGDMLALEHYWVSEKFDGVRAYWDGTQLLSRSGRRIMAPGWFTENFPGEPMDGELWLGHQRFAELSGRVRKHQPQDIDWQDIQYLIFDLPQQARRFDERLKHMQAIIPQQQVSWLKVIKQWRVADHEQLLQQLQQRVAAGAEGLMLHRGDSYYRAGRSGDLIKLKPLMDAEAKVLAHIGGKGKYTGMLGALLVETPSGRRFKIGSGFSDQERRAPPAIGSRISYQYTGKTSTGLPRFARFMRIRPRQ